MPQYQHLAVPSSNRPGGWDAKWKSNVFSPEVWSEMRSATVAR